MTEATSAADPKRLAKNSIWNLIGAVIPMLATIISTPILIGQIGTERFGLITLSWAIVGYLSIFDFGLGRTLTQSIASRIETHSPKEIAPIFWTSIHLMALFGAIAGLLSVIGAQTVLLNVIDVPNELLSEARVGLFILSLSLPIVITSAALRGALEAYQQFRSLSLLRTGLGLYTALSPLAVLPFTDNVAVIIGVLVGGRVLNWTLHWTLCQRFMPEIVRSRSTDRTLIRSLLGSGGWMTVSNVVSPLLNTFDRFLIASWISVAAVAYYTTPFDALANALVFPMSVAGVMFPTFATLGTHRQARFRSIILISSVITFAIMLFVSLTTILFAQDVLTIWLGDEFADRSTTVLQVLAFGMLAHSLAQVPFSFMQGIGRPDIPGRLNLMELPIYLTLLWVFVSQWGLVGAALAWSSRVSIDFVCLGLLSGKHAGLLARRPPLLPSLAVLMSLTLLPLATLPETFLAKVAFLVIGGVIHAGVVYGYLLNHEQRAALLAQVRLRLPLSKSATPA